MKKQLLFFALILLLAVSCKKDDDSASPIYGKWTVISGGGALGNGGIVKYIIIEPDSTYYLLHEYGYGLRGFEENLCQVINGQITFFTDWRFNIFNFNLDGSNLILNNPDAEIVCERTGNEPSKQEWVKTAATLSSAIDAPVESNSDLAYDGEFLWCGGYLNYDDPAYLFKINPATQSVAQYVPVSNWVNGIEWADGYLWTSDNGYDCIYKVNAVTGSNLFTSVEMGAWIRGIAFDGQYLWCGSHNAETIYKYHPVLNTIEATFKIGCQPGGMAYIQDHLYICVNGILNKCTVDPLQCVDAFDIEGGYIHGIAHDGDDFWVYVQFGDETPVYKIYKVSW